MALVKQPVTINFAKGVNQKADPKQLPVGTFAARVNSVFNKLGRLEKRAGYPALASLPDNDASYLTTFNGNLTAIGTQLRALSDPSDTWVTRGQLQPVDLDVLPLIRNSTNQSQADTAISSSGLVCLVYTDNLPSGGSTTPVYKYSVLVQATGQVIVAPSPIPVASGTVTNAPRVFALGRYFILVFQNTISGTPHLQYVAISVANPTMVTANTDISAQYSPSTTGSFDGAVLNNSLYLAWNGSDGGGAVRVTYLDSSLTLHATITKAGEKATLMSVSTDTSSSPGQVYVSYYDLATTTGRIFAVSPSLVTTLVPTTFTSTLSLKNLTSAAANGVCNLVYEVANSYSYSSSIPGDSSNVTNYVAGVEVTAAGSVGSNVVIARSVGLASKAFIVAGSLYFLAVYVSLYQPTYFLISGEGNVVAKLAYSNAGGYVTTGLPSVSLLNGTTAVMPYLRKDLVEAVNKAQGLANSAGIYSQTGINLATFSLGEMTPSSAEIGSNLHLTGGFLWAYDGYTPVEQGFHLWPDHVGLSASTTGGLMPAQQYYYQVTYEWADNQGNVHRSAPSIPVTVTTTGTTSSVTVRVPTLRLTYKIDNPLKIVVYRWSAGQQNYYQVTSILVPTLNNPAADSVSFVDTLADSAILGNNLIYTTGGVIENIAAPAIKAVTLYKNRLVALYAEDRNTLGFSKLVVASSPVEMSDLFTIYVSPSTGAQGSTGKCTFPASMDDKLITFKSSAIYYNTGNGPDATGGNNDFSEPTFITGTVGSDNPASIVMQPNGLMFQSEKGIWLLGRDLSTSYIGAPVEDYTANARVQSAVSIPDTNEVRFTLSSGITLVYDYYVGEWGTYEGVPAVSSTLYQGRHTYINAQGQAFQQAAGTYLDGTRPVLMRFKTGWLNLTGLTGYQRAYFFFLLGDYVSPHKLSISVAYDYHPAPTQTMLLTPDNYSPAYGLQPGAYGSGSPFGGPQSLEEWRVFFNTQRCQAFQVSVAELYDPTQGQAAGAGLTVSGLSVIIGQKKGWPTIKAANSIS